MEHKIVYQCMNCKVFGHSAVKTVYNGREYYEMTDHPEPYCSGSGIWDVVGNRLFVHRLIKCSDLGSRDWFRTTKVQRRVLRELYAELFDDRGTYGKIFTSSLGGRPFSHANTISGGIVILGDNWRAQRIFTGDIAFVEGDPDSFDRDMVIARMFLEHA